MNIPDDILYVASTISDDNKTPLVRWHFKESVGLLTLPEARARAEALFMAIAISETEAKIAKKLSSKTKHKGFGKRSDESEAQQVLVNILHLMRMVRSPLAKGINPIFGARTQCPLIQLSCYGPEFTIEIEAARHHAFALMGAADASESDRFFHHFLGEKLSIPKPEVNKLLSEFKDFRERASLEYLL